MKAAANGGAHAIHWASGVLAGVNSAGVISGINYHSLQGSGGNSDHPGFGILDWAQEGPLHQDLLAPSRPSRTGEPGLAPPGLNPPAVSILRAETIPSVNGDTRWTNLAVAMQPQTQSTAPLDPCRTSSL